MKNLMLLLGFFVISATVAYAQVPGDITVNGNPQPQETTSQNPNTNPPPRTRRGETTPRTTRTTRTSGGQTSTPPPSTNPCPAPGQQSQNRNNRRNGQSTWNRTTNRDARSSRRPNRTTSTRVYSGSSRQRASRERVDPRAFRARVQQIARQISLTDGQLDYLREFARQHQAALVADFSTVQGQEERLALRRYYIQEFDREVGRTLTPQQYNQYLAIRATERDEFGGRNTVNFRTQSNRSFRTNGWGLN